MADINDYDNSASNNTGRAPENMPASAVNDAIRENEAIIARWHHGTNGSIASSGSGNAYVFADPRTLPAYYDGLVLCFDANHENTGAATIDVDGLGAKDIKKHNDQALASGDIKAGQKVLCVYDDTNFQMLSPLGNSPPGQWYGDADGDADALTITDTDDALFSGFTARFRAIAANVTATPTLARGSSADKTIVQADGSALAVGTFQIGGVYAATYEATADKWFLASSSAVSDEIDYGLITGAVSSTNDYGSIT